MNPEWLLCVIPGILLILLAAKIHLLHRAADELCLELSRILSEETNNLITLHSRDRYMRRLAASLNLHLRRLGDDRRRFRQGDAELKEAISNISHDLRTPLTAINGYLHLLRQETAGSEKAGRYLSAMENRTELLRQLTEELFLYSILISPGIPPKTELSLNSALEESLASHYTALTEKGITPSVSMPASPVIRLLDASSLSRILDNLIGNALKYSAKDLDIRLREDGTILFSNAAEGLDAVQAGQLFNRFYTLQTGRGSTGLGLAIARTLTEQQGGRIEAAYEAGRLSITLAFPENIRQDAANMDLPRFL